MPLCSAASDLRQARVSLTEQAFPCLYRPCRIASSAASRKREVSGEVDALGGTFDGSGYDDRAFIFTLPVDATFPVIEGVFDRFVEQHPGSEWLFGNVYSSDGFTPLGWWETP